MELVRCCQCRRRMDGDTEDIVEANEGPMCQACAAIAFASEGDFTRRLHDGFTMLNLTDEENDSNY